MRYSCTDVGWLRTDFVEEIATMSEFHQHIHARYVACVGVRLNNEFVYERYNVGVFERGLDANLFVQVFALRSSSFVSQKDHFACFNRFVSVVDGLIDPACGG